jgi:hypothetical protein
MKSVSAVHDQPAAEFWTELRAGPQPLPVLYLLCDGCGNVTPRTSVQKTFSVTNRGITGGTPESLCAACQHAQPRVVDEIPAPARRSSAPDTRTAGPGPNVAASPAPARSSFPARPTWSSALGAAPNNPAPPRSVACFQATTQGN